MKNKIAVPLILAASTALSFGSFTIPVASGTFTTQGETQHFWLANAAGTNAGLLTQVTLTLTSAASQSGTIITNNDTSSASFTGAISSSYATTVLGFLAGGAVNLADSQTEILNPGQYATYNVSDSGSVIVNFTGPYAALFTTLTSGVGDIQATTLSSAYSNSSSPLALSYSSSGGTGSTSYTWEMTYTIPEPTTALLGGLGLLGLLRRRRV